MHVDAVSQSDEEWTLHKEKTFRNQTGRLEHLQRPPAPKLPVARLSGTLQRPPAPSIASQWAKNHRSQPKPKVQPKPPQALA